MPNAVRITEHTTTDDTYCIVELVATNETVEVYGDLEYAKTEAISRGFTVIEEILS